MVSPFVWGWTYSTQQRYTFEPALGKCPQAYQQGHKLGYGRQSPGCIPVSSPRVRTR